MKLIIAILLFIAQHALSKPNIDPRVVGGEAAIPKEFPHQISLQWNYNTTNRANQHFCGGSILNERWVISAGHCNIKYSVTGFVEVVAGEYNLALSDPTRQKRRVVNYFVHEKYPGGGVVSPNDLGLILIDSPFTFNDAVQPVTLPLQGAIPSGQSIISGWGSTSNSIFPSYPSILQKAILPIIEYSACEKLWPGSPLAPSNVCAGPLSGAQSVCSGDSGGPLIQKDNNGKVTQIGIVSWGTIPCGTPKRPGVFVRVSFYIDWINKTLAGNS